MDLEAITSKDLELNVNGKGYDVEVRTNETLLRVLNEKIGLTGAKTGCESGECGACTVLIDGEPRLSCLTLAVECEGKKIETIEGLADFESNKLHPVQEAFIENFGFQCGYCTPGFIMVAKAFLDKTGGREFTDEEIREAIAGNLCRCGDYISITQSIRAAAGKMKK
jgi:aerobic-type carbon monoxide dehydrogenase small subunit (CoxS/CutS family)